VSFSKRKLIIRSALAALALAGLAYLFLPTAEKNEVQKANLEPVATGQIPPVAPLPEPQRSSQLPTANVAEPASPAPIGTQSAAQAPSPDTPASPHQTQSVAAVPEPQPAPKPQTSIDARPSSPAPSATESTPQPPSPQTPPSPPQARPIDVPPQVAAPGANKLQSEPSAAATQNLEVLFVQRPGVNIRSAPSRTSRIVGAAPMGTRFEVTNREGNWVAVESGPLKGWINRAFLAAIEPQPSVTLGSKGSATGTAPTIDIKKTCQTAQKTITEIFGDDTAITFDGCMRQEQDAGDRLAKDWATYPAEDRQRCVNRTGYMPSYVEWLTCFEMVRDVRQMRKDEPAAPKSTTKKAQKKSAKS
jgi:uncharacterized protein YraI